MQSSNSVQSVPKMRLKEVVSKAQTLTQLSLILQVYLCLGQIVSLWFDTELQI